ncbi:MAG: molybdenum ABC transporter ATP-binding protein [Halioglobus sp.]|nr:molybdenum ABC transporter ATP-binding protein [Halioglobus sp.]
MHCELPAHGVTAIYGPSGSGKTTLLDCIAGLRHPDLGSEIRLGDTTWLSPALTLPPWQRRIGYVFQEARLFPHLDVEQNLRFGLSRSGQKAPLTYDEVADLLELTAFRSRHVDALSAGQKQRVAIARALLSAPRLLLLDEPLANLDHAASRDCLRCLQRLSQELRLPMLYVSHDIEEVSQIADHLLLLEAGRMVEQGSLLSLCSRLDTHLSREEKAAAILTATVAGHDSTFGLTKLSVEGQTLLVNRLPDAPGLQRRVRVPARDVSVCRERPGDSSILNIVGVTITEVEDTDATRLLLRLSLGSQHLLARITRKSAVELGLRTGDKVYAQVKSAALLIETVDHT